ncbi:Myb/SANT-like domain-containing protein [Rhynchospora pubera]|uniref:Myb/SANT-like domain-containing protein n=1 Tax=Rhynchospora pubera TaxID=906938 RepID=A0AAV8DZ09_9POAL|nr:Myb/SANT-like domain-containing protein [Rhynchospora pubera]KAJ4774010.1 Myb/SANT-like domain-containing protein [Rhynchospora pubera]
MELVCISSSSKKKDKVSTNDNPPVKIDPKRQSNWSEPETDTLLEVVGQVQSENDMVGFSFNSKAWTRIFTLFKTKIPGTKREKCKLQNRIKVLYDRFKVCHELADTSGGGWDNVKKRPAAPSEEEYQDKIKAKGPKAKFLSGDGQFPWYPTMVPMVGGQSSRGNVSKST